MNKAQYNKDTIFYDINKAIFLQWALSLLSGTTALAFPKDCLNNGSHHTVSLDLLIECFLFSPCKSHQGANPLCLARASNHKQLDYIILSFIQGLWQHICQRKSHFAQDIDQYFIVKVGPLVSQFIIDGHHMLGEPTFSMSGCVLWTYHFLYASSVHLSKILLLKYIMIWFYVWLSVQFDVRNILIGYFHSQ